MKRLPIRPYQDATEYFLQRAEHCRLAASETNHPDAHLLLLNLAAQWEDLAQFTQRP